MKRHLRWIGYWKGDRRSTARVSLVDGSEDGDIGWWAGETKEAVAETLDDMQETLLRESLREVFRGR